MSDYQDSNVFSGWGERDDWRDADQAEHDRADARHERFLDARDRDLPYLSLGTGETSAQLADGTTERRPRPSEYPDSPERAAA